jgi:hypothetical protein
MVCTATMTMQLAASRAHMTCSVESICHACSTPFALALQALSIPKMPYMERSVLRPLNDTRHRTTHTTPHPADKHITEYAC